MDRKSTGEKIVINKNVLIEEIKYVRKDLNGYLITYGRLIFLKSTFWQQFCLFLRV